MVVKWPFKNCYFVRVSQAGNPTSKMILKSVFSQLMGNPSDGFNGKTISLSIKNFWAEVTIFESARLSLIPHPLNDPTEFGSLGTIHILRHIQYEGYGNTGCGVFKWEVQNQKGFCLKINILKENYWINGKLSKSVKNHPNLFHGRIPIQDRIFSY